MSFMGIKSEALFRILHLFKVILRTHRCAVAVAPSRTHGIQGLFFATTSHILALNLFQHERSLKVRSVVEDDTLSVYTLLESLHMMAAVLQVWKSHKIALWAFWGRVG